MDQSEQTSRQVNWVGAFDAALLVQRIGVAGLTLWFGIEKLVKFRALLANFPDPLGIGSSSSLILTIVAQVPCAALVLVGCQTRLASVPPLIAMLVAAFFVHANDPDIYVRNALIYAVSFLSLVISGAGKFSVDRVLAALSVPKEDKTAFAESPSKEVPQ